MTRKYFLSISIIGLFFFIFGFVTWLNGILIPYLKIACELSDFQALFVAFAFYISYTVMALPSAWILKKTGFRKGMMVGLLVMAAGTLVFIPAALSRTYGFFLTGLFTLGTGLAILQTASNPYITILGPQETAARRISIMGICNKLAGAIAPVILAYFILHDGDALIQSLTGMDDNARAVTLDMLARRVIAPYLGMTAILLLLGILIRYAPLPEIETESNTADQSVISEGKQNIFQFPHLILGVMAIFFYVGIEVIAGDTVIRYGLSLGVPLASAQYYTSMVLIAMVVGYFIGIALIPGIISQRQLLAISAVAGILFTFGVVFSDPTVKMAVPMIDFTTMSFVKLVIPVTVFFVILLGVANAIVWPAIWPLAIHDLGSFIKTGSALLIMGIAGGAILPVIWGYLSDIFSPSAAYWIAVPCYLFILYFSVHGYKVRSWK